MTIKIESEVFLLVEAIYASKLYKSSRNKDRINAAIADPINKELVQQLARYFGYAEYVDGPRVEEPVAEHDERFIDNAGIAFLNEDDATEAAQADEVEKALDAEETEIAGDAEGADEDINLESAIQVVNSTPITAHRKVVEPISDIVRGTLNAREDTCGVNRVLVRGDELWVHYEDKMNLNNVMGAVIEFLNAAGYTYLEFNRLARSDNAIVFQIIHNDTNNAVRPISADGETEE